MDITNLDDLKQLLLTVDAANGESMEKLDHKTRESLERARNADVRINFNQNSLRGMDVHLQKTSLIERRIKEREKALGSKIASV